MTKTRVKRYVLGKDNMPMTTIGRRLYRTDEDLMTSISGRDSEFVLYDIDATQPRLVSKVVGSTDTMAYIRIAKSTVHNGISKLGFFNQHPQTIIYLIIGGIIIFAVATGGLVT